MTEHQHVYEVVAHQTALLGLEPFDILQCVIPGCVKMLPRGYHRGEDGEVYVTIPRA